MFDVVYTPQVKATEEEKIEEPSPEKKLSGLELRKPDQIIQNTLKTGYEPMIASRNDNNMSAAPASGTILIQENGDTDGETTVEDKK